MKLRIATWNVNSVRRRLDLVKRLAAEKAPHVLCLQETKVEDKDFPLEPFVELGYRHILIHGMKSYNGVAIVSRVPLEKGRLPPRLCHPAGWDRAAQRLRPVRRRHSRSEAK